MVKYSAAECRDPSRWRRTKLNGEIVEFRTKQGEWVDVLRVGRSAHGRGLFAMQPFQAGDPICAYFGKLVPAHTHPERESDMVMRSGVSQYVIKGRPSSAISGAIFVNDVRGTKKQPNSKITVGRYNLKRHTEQMAEFRRQGRLQRKLLPSAMAVGTVIPYFKCTRPIKVNQEILASYGWTEAEWQLNRETGGGGKKRRT